MEHRAATRSPAVVPARYAMRRANQAVLLYRGHMGLGQGTRRLATTGRLQLVWAPFPMIRFEVDVDERSSAHRIDITRPLRLKVGKQTYKAVATHEGFGGDRSISGYIVNHPDYAGNRQFARADFHLINFRPYLGGVVRDRRASWRGRLQLLGGGWTVTLDLVRDGRDLYQESSSTHGYALTHAGRLARTDGATFTDGDLDAFATNLGWYLSFASGRWCMPGLITTFDTRRQAIWQEWWVSNAGRCKAQRTWTDEWFPENVEAPFAGYLNRMAQPVWRQALTAVFGWYLESNAQSGTIETGIVLEQTALELLAWTLFVEELRTVDAGAFDRVRAQDKVRRLLSWAGIPVSIPSALPGLRRLAVREGWKDLPHAFTEMRHSVVHARKLGRLLATETRTRSEANQAGLWLLELVLLRLFGHQGQYTNRLRQRRHGEQQRVPWAGRGTQARPSMESSPLRPMP